MENLAVLKKQLLDSVAQLDEDNVLKLSDQLLNTGVEPIEILEIMNDGMKQVGDLYQSGDYYIADLIMAGVIYKEVLEHEKMVSHFHKKAKEKIGLVVLGTVAGDIHEIGKGIFKGILETHGFEVIDIGVDVTKEEFVRSVVEHKPQILGLSGILTITTEPMKEVIDALKDAGVRDKVKVILGGDHINDDICKYIGADAFANEATEGLKICRQWLITE